MKLTEFKKAPRPMSESGEATHHMIGVRNQTLSPIRATLIFTPTGETIKEAILLTQEEMVSEFIPIRNKDLSSVSVKAVGLEGQVASPVIWSQFIRVPHMREYILPA